MTEKQDFLFLRLPWMLECNRSVVNHKSAFCPTISVVATRTNHTHENYGVYKWPSFETTISSWPALVQIRTGDDLWFRPETNKKIIDSQHWPQIKGWKSSSGTEEFGKRQTLLILRYKHLPIEMTLHKTKFFSLHVHDQSRWPWECLCISGLWRIWEQSHVV